MRRLITDARIARQNTMGVHSCRRRMWQAAVVDCQGLRRVPDEGTGKEDHKPIMLGKSFTHRHLIITNIYLRSQRD